MSLVDLYAEGIDESITRWARNPGPEPDPGFSMTSFLGSGLKGIPSGALEVSGSVADVLSGFGTAAASADSRAGGMFSLPTEQEKKQQEEARQRMLRGEAFDTSAGHVLRRKAQEFGPDPQTAHQADQVLHGLTRFGSKAVGAVVTMGPAAGPVVLGLEEGNTVTQNLRAEGVDTETAVKVGAVTGAVAAAGVRLPLSGATWAQTAGLVAIGGPGAYIAQEATARKILEEAGYLNQASLHNPFDPLGLALSTVIPGAFGAFHMRSQRRPALEKIVEHIESGGKRYGEDGKLLTSPKGEQGEMQVMPGTAGDPGFGVTPARDGSPEELARVGRDYLRAMLERYGDTDKALAAYNAGPGALDRAVAKSGDAWLKSMPKETQEYVHKANALGARHLAEVAAKDEASVDAARVKVLDATVARSLPDTPDAYAQMLRASDVVAEGRVMEPAAPNPERVRIEQELAAIEIQRAELLPVAGDLAERGAIREARQELAIMEQQRPDTSDAAVKALAKEIQAQDGVSYKTALSAAKKQAAEMVADFEGRVGRLEQAVARNAEAQRATEGLVELDRRQEVLRQELSRMPLDMPQPAGLTPISAAARSLPPPDSVTMQTAKPAARAAAADAQPQKPGTPAAPAAAKGGAQDGAAADAKPGEAPSPEQAMAQQLAAEQPDLQVILPGEETPITVREALARIAEQQKQETQFADLVKVAAECALSS